MNISGKLFGVVLIIIGIALCCVEIIISTTISEIADVVASLFGLSGSASLGLAILFHVPAAGLIGIIFIVIVAAFYLGYAFIVES